MIPPSVEENADIDDAEAASVGREGDDSTTLSAKEELPSLEDRKTFLNCLTCLLVSSYKYDMAEEGMEDEKIAEEAAETVPNNPNKSFCSESVSSDDDCDIPGSRNEVSMFLDEDDDEDIEGSREKPDRNQQENGSSRKRGIIRRFGRNSTNTNNKDSTATESGSGGSTSDSPSTRTLKLEQKRQNKRLSRAQAKRHLASKRHYQRRYLIACQLLQSSCEMLIIEKEIGKELYEQLKAQLEVLKTPRVVPSSVQSPNQKSGIGRAWSSLAGASGDETDENDSGGEGEENDRQAKTSKRTQQQFLKQSEWMTEWDPQLADHLNRISPGAGYKCLCWLLFQLLLHANKKRGYDARVRYALKSLAVAVLVQDIEHTLDYKQGEENDEDYTAWKLKNYTTWVSFATRKFEQVEHAIADRLIKLAQANEQNAGAEATGSQNAAVSLEDLDGLEDEVQVVSVKDGHVKKVKGARKQLVRGLKIGAVGITAGTLLAVTGGMAAPAIAGALTFMGMGAVATTFVSLASTTAVVHIFGVAGGSLAAYKMKRRTAGLTDFSIVESSVVGAGKATKQKDDPMNPSHPFFEAPKEKPRFAKWAEKAKAFTDKHTSNRNSKTVSQAGADGSTGQAELSRTICISGWLTDRTDFQRPWGITPTQPKIKDKVEILQRFYRVYNPDLIPMCKNLLKRWKSEEATFWELLEDKYGSNPDTLLPLKFGPLHDAALTEDELKLLDKLIAEIDEVHGKKKKSKHANLPEHIQSTIAADETNIMESQGFHNADDVNNDNIFPSEKFSFDDDSISLHEQTTKAAASEQQRQLPAPHHHQRQCYASVFEQVPPSKSLDKFFLPEHLSTVWDFSSRYGGEVYTVHWESHMLMKLSECFREVALTATASAGQQALRLMVANTVALAASIPVYLLQGIDAIDETWTVVVGRADEAGKELARSLLINEAGHRPVTLVGYSFGSRVIFSCLKQLAVYQQQWEQYHEEKDARAIGFAAHSEEDDRIKSRKEKKWMLAELEFDREPASIVEDVVVMGAPMYLSLSSWRACRQVVAGRFVNCYSRKDRILSIMFKYKQFLESFKPVVGNCTVAVPGVENVDVSDLVENHQDYVFMLSNILKRVRHGQPVRSSTNALDEVALIAEAETLAVQQQQSAEIEVTRPSEPETPT